MFSLNASTTLRLIVYGLSIVLFIVFAYRRSFPKVIGTFAFILKNRRRWFWLFPLLLPSFFFLAPHPNVLAKANGPYQESAVWGSYGVFSLFDPQQKSIPAVLRSELNIDGKLVVLRDGPVYSSILSFINDSGNQDLFKGDPGIPPVYAINNGQETRASFERKAQAQSLIQFQKDALINEEDKTIVAAKLIEHFKPFSTVSDDAKFTSSERVAYDPKGNHGFLTQYPRLAAVQRYNLKLGSYQIGEATQDEQVPLSKNKWLGNVIEANPDWRGLIGFRYPFSSKPDISMERCTAEQFLYSESTATQFTPYVRFISMKVGSNGLPRELAGLSYTKRFADGSLYQLRSAEDRPSGSHGNSDLRTLELPAQLDPGSNLIIPVEFGFQYVPSRDQLKPRPWSNPVFILNHNADPPSSKHIFREINSKNLKELRLNPGFVGMMKNRSDEIPISHRITVGQVIDHIEITEPSRLVPADVAYITIGQMVGLGSCPYLVVYDRANGYWVDYGTVLVARNAKSLQREELYQFTRNISRIMIQEREDEITYIDQVRLAYTDPVKGLRVDILPPDNALANADQSFIVLRKGESWQFDFSSLVPDVATDLEVRINGYYEIVKPEHRLL